jgi:hypothetical protein
MYTTYTLVTYLSIALFWLVSPLFSITAPLTGLLQLITLFLLHCSLSIALCICTAYYDTVEFKILSSKKKNRAKKKRKEKGMM